MIVQHGMWSFSVGWRMRKRHRLSAGVATLVDDSRNLGKWLEVVAGPLVVGLSWPWWRS
jgi:hypothetical protein